MWGATQQGSHGGVPLSDFNPRPPCGGRQINLTTAVGAVQFQSTPPVWGATCSGSQPGCTCSNFNPRPPCGGRLVNSYHYNLWRKIISIHAPRVGGDLDAQGDHEQGVFQSTPPVWGATPGRQRLRDPRQISIHAPRVGGDFGEGAATDNIIKFQSTPPVWGATSQSYQPSAASQIFQSTPPVWGATCQTARPP